MSNTWAYVILKKGKHIATIRMSHSKAGVVRAVCKTYTDTYTETQTGKASGYGYDKATAALAGMVIDGVMLVDHCRKHADEASDAAVARILKAYGAKKLTETQASDKLRALGANFYGGVKDGGRYTPGVDRLRDMGYQVIYV